MRPRPDLKSICGVNVVYEPLPWKICRSTPPERSVTSWSYASATLTVIFRFWEDFVAAPPNTDGDGRLSVCASTEGGHTTSVTRIPIAGKRRCLTAWTVAASRNDDSVAWLEGDVVCRTLLTDDVFVVELEVLLLAVFRAVDDDMLRVGVFQQSAADRDELQDGHLAHHRIHRVLRYISCDVYNPAPDLPDHDGHVRIFDEFRRGLEKPYTQLFGCRAGGVDFVEQRQGDLAVGTHGDVGGHFLVSPEDDRQHVRGADHVTRPERGGRRTARRRGSLRRTDSLLGRVSRGVERQRDDRQQSDGCETHCYCQYSLKGR